MNRRRGKRAPVGDMIPGTAVKLPRRSTDQIIAATSRPVTPVPDQGDLVDHWHECGLLDDEQRAEFDGEQS
ncbi:hypothetical protein [Streptomyces sp. NBC_01373]|uniref:hypothetical protein n=1 Tax=Streptomyces sp. NBC_01373 TaxID=2903843 RepID=UPI00225695E0|nr:hypothetical protein [Streptomyces sp. NBC_01373]MCX4705682.1 hypothetical protein [Streptomyces sp. NBC_01373]